MQNETRVERRITPNQTSTAVSSWRKNSRTFDNAIIKLQSCSMCLDSHVTHEHALQPTVLVKLKQFGTLQAMRRWQAGKRNNDKSSKDAATD